MRCEQNHQKCLDETTKNNNYYLESQGRLACGQKTIIFIKNSGVEGVSIAHPLTKPLANMAWLRRLLFLDSLMMDLTFLGRNFSKRDLNLCRRH